MTIDVHAHLYPPAYLERLTRMKPGGLQLERAGDDFVLSVGGRHFVTFTPAFYDSDVRLHAMDTAGVETQLLTLAPPMVFWAQPHDALELCRTVNDHLAALGERHPTRFIPAAVLPLQAPDLAVQELRRAAEMGHRAVLMPSNASRMELDDPRLEPVFEALEAADLPMFVHPIAPAGVECMHDYRLDISVGFPTDTTLAAARVILSGTMDRHPALRFCWAHLGGCLPWLGDRIEMVRGRIPGASARTPRSVRDHLTQFWYDTAVPTHATLAAGVDLVGTKRIVFGTDVPFFDDMTAHILELVRTAPFLDDAQRRDILEVNAQSFLGEGAQTGRAPA